MLSSFGVSDRGPVRQINEDCFLVDRELSLFVVADGMGGHAAGEVASRLTVEAVENFIRRSEQCDDVSWPCGIDSQLSFHGNRVRTAIHLANRRVFRVAESNDDYTGMGSTIVCALIRDGQLVIGHVGDSRLYGFSRGVLQARTRDDTWAATVLSDTAAGVDATALASHPMRHVLTNVLGARDQADIHVSQHELAAETTLLLCSDGLHNVVDDEAIARVLAAGDSVEAAARTLVSTAIDRGTRDNVTAVVIRYGNGA
jgi:serine/threonine protein phosphatase PrpC